MNRRDLSNFRMLIVDSSETRDRDDGFFVEKTDEGYRLVVAIADVTHFIKEGSEIDREALKRGNTTYCLGNTTPMIPRELSNGLLSLNEGEDKFLAIFEMIFSPTGEMLGYDFYKGYSNNLVNITYSEVNEVLEKGTASGTRYEDIEESIFVSEELFTILERKYQSMGKIELDIKEVYPITDDNGKIIELKARERGIAERMIEHFMVATNRAVGMEINRKTEGKYGVYRVHDAPRIESFMKLKDFVTANEIKVDMTFDEETGITTDLYQRIVKAIEGSKSEMLLNKLVLMSMSKAEYSSNNIGHFGLSLDFYSHSTSPIRRYSDIIAHRIIFNEKLSVDQIDNMCAHISKTERKSAEMEREVLKIKICEFMGEKIGEEFSGVITGFNDKKIFIKLDNYVDVVADIPSGFKYDDKGMKVTMNSISFDIGEEVEVEVERINNKKHEVYVSIV